MPRHKKEASDESDEQAKPAGSQGQQSEEAQDAPVEHSVSSPVSDAMKDASNRVAVGGKAEAMRAKLKAERKVRVLIPLANGEKAGVTQSVILNGYSLYIRKGEYVDVPESVADVLEAKMKNKLAVDNHPLRADAEGGVKMDRFGQ